MTKIIMGTVLAVLGLAVYGMLAQAGIVINVMGALLRLIS